MTRAGAIRSLVIVTALVLLELVCRLGLVNPKLIVAPSDMAARLTVLMQQSVFWRQVSLSALCVVEAFAAAAVLGCLISVVLHRLAGARHALEPLFASYYAIPFFVFNPLLAILLGMNTAPIITVGFLYAVMAVIVGTLNGLDRIPRVFERTGRAFGLGGIRQSLLILLPAAAPQIFTGMKLAFGYAVTGVLGSEFILSTGGFGYAISFAYNSFDDRTMYALLLFLLIVVSAMTMALHGAGESVEHRSGPVDTLHKGEGSTLAMKTVASLVVAGLVLGAWQLANARVGDEGLASPTDTIAQLFALCGTGPFWGHVEETAKALGLSLLVSCVVGTLVGVALGVSPTAGKVIEPVLVALYALPKVALYPVVLLLFGIGISAKIAFGALYGLIPMILIAMTAVGTLNPVLRRTARAMQLTNLQILVRVLIPATMPEIVTGIRISFSITLLGVLIGEMFASRRGLGYLVMNGINVNDTATMMAVTVLVTTFAITTNSILMAIEKTVRRS